MWVATFVPHSVFLVGKYVSMDMWLNSHWMNSLMQIANVHWSEKCVNFIEYWLPFPFWNKKQHALPSSMNSFEFPVPMKYAVCIENRSTHWTLMTQFNKQFQYILGRQNESFHMLSIQSVPSLIIIKKKSEQHIRCLESALKSHSHFMLKSMH